MMEKLIYKHTTLAVAGLIALTVIIGFVALRNTSQLLFRYFELRSSLANIADVPPGPARENFNNTFEEVDLNAALFKAITESAKKHNIQVKNINTPEVSSNADVTILTEEVKLEGGFINTVKCLDDAVLELKQIKLSSLKFERDLTPKSSALYTTVYFQTIRKNEKSNN